MGIQIQRVGLSKAREALFLRDCQKLEITWHRKYLWPRVGLGLRRDHWFLCFLLIPPHTFTARTWASQHPQPSFRMVETLRCTLYRQDLIKEQQINVTTWTLKKCNSVEPEPFTRLYSFLRSTPWIVKGVSTPPAHPRALGMRGSGAPSRGSGRRELASRGLNEE